MIDYKLIENYIAGNKSRGPDDFLEVTKEVWNYALDFAEEYMSHGDEPEKLWTTESYWTCLFVAAQHYCFGFREMRSKLNGEGVGEWK